MNTHKNKVKLSKPETNALSDGVPTSRFALDLENIISHRMTRLLWRIYEHGDRGDLGDLKVSLREWRVVAALGEKGRLSVNGISDYSGIGHTVTSRAVKSLREKKCVETRKSTLDKRHTLVQLTQEGLRVHDIIAKRRKKFLTEIQLGLSAKEQSTFFMLMDKLEAHIEKLSCNDGDGWD